MWPSSGMSWLYLVCYVYIGYVISVFGMLFPPWLVGSALGGLKKKFNLISLKKNLNPPWLWVMWHHNWKTYYDVAYRHHLSQRCYVVAEVTIMCMNLKMLGSLALSCCCGMRSGHPPWESGAKNLQIPCVPPSGSGSYLQINYWVNRPVYWNNHVIGYGPSETLTSELLAQDFKGDIATFRPSFTVCAPAF